MAGAYLKKQQSGREPSRAAALFWKILTWILVIVSVLMMAFTIVSVSTFDRNDRSIFGYKAYIVQSDSMSATDFSAGDLILVKEVDPTTLKPGDIISYSSTNVENFGATVTHKIRSLTTDAQGKPGFVTYGTTTNTDDLNVVTYGYVLGKYEMHIPKVGTFFRFLKTTPGYLICIFLPFLLLILSQGFKSIRLFRQYKAEQMAELTAQREAEQAQIAAERARLEEDRKRSEEMMQKLLEMQAALEAKQREE